MKKNNVFFTAVILCSMILASCAAPRTFVPYARSSVSTESLVPGKNYEIINTITAEAVVAVSSKKGTLEIEPDSGEFLNICNVADEGVKYNVEKSKGILLYGLVEGLDLGDPDPCDGNSMASGLAAYKLIKEIKNSEADGIVAPMISVDVEETGTGFFSRTVTYKVVITAKLVKIH